MIWLNIRNVKKKLKAYGFLYEKMSTISQIEEEFNYKYANYYNSSKLDYYKSDAFN